MLILFIYRKPAYGLLLRRTFYLYITSFFSLTVVVRSELIGHHGLLAMSKDELGICSFGQHMNHLVAALPIIMIAC